MQENIKRHQQIGDAIAFAKKKLFANSKAGQSLRRVCDQFIIDVARMLADIVPEMRTEPGESESVALTPDWKHIESLAIASVAEGQEKQQYALTSLLNEIVICAGNGGDVEGVAITARDAVFCASESVRDVAIDRLLSAEIVRSGRKGVSDAAN